MAQIKCPIDYVPLQQVTAANLNAHVNNAILEPGSITDQVSLSSGTVAAEDGILIHDTSAPGLRKTTAGDLVNSGLPITTSSLTGVSGSDLVITPAAGQKVDIAGNIEVNDINSTGTVTVEGDISVAGLAVFGVTEVSSLTIDNKTPLTAEDNLTKIYVVSGVASGATGGGVDNLVYQTPVLSSIPSDETWIYEMFVQTTSGYVNGNTRADYGTVSLKVFNNTTLLTTINGSTSPYGAHTATHTYAKAFTSADNGAQLILKTRNVWGLNEEPRYTIKLSKVKTASLSDQSSCI